jgi:hypothetical protein
MEIKLNGYQLVEAAQDFVKKEFGVDLSAAQCYEAWVNIDHYKTEYKRNKNGTVKRNSKGHLVVDEEKSKRIQQTFPAPESMELELLFEPKREDES